MARHDDLLAHSPSKNGKRTDTVAGHLTEVARLAEQYAAPMGLANEAKLAGLLHDLGKYGRLFQLRLKGKASGVDHWSAGAWEILVNYPPPSVIPTALAVQGHHLGLQWADRNELIKLNPAHPQNNHSGKDRPGLQHAEPDMAILRGRLAEDGIILPPQEQLTGFLDPTGAAHRLARMVDTRMLFSCLVDADYTATEAHFNADDNGRAVYREEGPELRAERDLAQLENYITELAAESESDPKINKIRADLFQACLTGGEQPPGLFTLTAPTGAGKTLSMLAFALKHAAANKLRRVIMVIPYLSIIDQTVQVYREFYGRFLSPAEAESYVLENHSLAGTKKTDEKQIEGDEPKKPDQKHRPRPHLQAQNWDAPVVVTTSVQFLESLFANRSSACRKLHRLAESVILFDEVQTLPLNLAGSILASLRRLHDRFGASVIFSTATQPAFDSLTDTIRERIGGPWDPKELVPPQLGLFDRAKRVSVHWPDKNETVDWPAMAGRMAEHDRALCIVNLKRHAWELLKLLEKNEIGDLFHLSTTMCPAHRRAVLDRIRRRLKDKRLCRLVATQCVEAGVDLDFPVVYRAFAPLDAVAQAAGRCNRNGGLASNDGPALGQVIVFRPVDDGKVRYPTGAYGQAADTAAGLLSKWGDLDINDPEVFRAYYQRLYNIAQVENQDAHLQEFITASNFKNLADAFKVINSDAVNVLVPYDPPVFARLRDQVKDEGLTKAWLFEARPHTIGLYRPPKNSPAGHWLEPIPDRRGRPLDDWFIYDNPDHYHQDMGLIPEDDWSGVI